MADGDETDRERDALILKMAGQKPMSHDELKAKLAAERPVKKGADDAQRTARPKR